MRQAGPLQPGGRRWSLFLKSNMASAIAGCALNRIAALQGTGRGNAAGRKQPGDCSLCGHLGVWSSIGTVHI